MNANTEQSREVAVKQLIAEAEIGETQRILKGAGIDVLVLKGPHLANTVYEREADRSYGDLDLLVRPLPRRPRRPVCGSRGIHYYRHFVLGLGRVVFLRLAAGFVFRIYGGVLLYAGISDLVDIIKSMSIATAAFVVAMVLIGFRGFPRSVIAIDWVGSIMLVGGLRFTLRVIREALQPGLEEHERKRVLIIGAGDAGEALVRDLQRTYRDRYEVVGFVDDNKSKQGLRIHDVPVLGPILYLGDFVPRYRVDEVIIAIPSATGAQMRQIVDITKIAGVRTRTIPGIDQLIDGTVTVNQVRDVAIEDLLGREPVELEEGLLRKFLFDKIVMVTGARVPRRQGHIPE